MSKWFSIFRFDQQSIVMTKMINLDIRMRSHFVLIISQYNNFVPFFLEKYICLTRQEGHTTLMKRDNKRGGQGIDNPKEFMDLGWFEMDQYWLDKEITYVYNVFKL